MVALVVYGGNLKAYIFKQGTRYNFKIYHVGESKMSIVFESVIRYQDLKECVARVRSDLSEMLGIDEGLLSTIKVNVNKEVYA